jgi:hypothetical protein
VKGKSVSVDIYEVVVDPPEADGRARSPERASDVER